MDDQPGASVDGNPFLPRCRILVRMPASAYRTVEIKPPSIRDETVIVLRAAVVIVIATWLYRENQSAPARTRSGGSAPAAERVAPPYQKLFAALPPDQQRMFRALHEGLLEAENVRSATGAWPSPATLAGQGVPPFAADPITDRARYVWTMREEANIVNYIGIPANPKLPAFLLLILEPAPGSPPDPTPNDEGHHRLTNGDVLHVSVWMHAPPAPLKSGLIAIPEATGWDQLLAGNTALPNQ